MDPYNKLQMTPKSKQTSEMILKCVEEFILYAEDWEILRHASRKALTREAVEIAVSRNGYNIRHVPKRMLDYKLCMLSVSSTGSSLSSIPDCYMTYDLCKAATKNDGLSLQFVPENLIDSSLCTIAVSNNGLALQYIPSRFVTTNLCNLAVRSSGLALEHVPHKLITKRMCEEAAKHDAGSGYRTCLEYVPKKYRTGDYWTNICKSAVDSNINSAMFVAREYPHLINKVLPPPTTTEDVEHLISRNRNLFKCLPDDYVCDDLWTELIEDNPSNYSILPEAKLRDHTLINLAVRSDASIIKDVPSHCITAELVALAYDAGIDLNGLDIAPGLIAATMCSDLSSKVSASHDPVRLEHETPDKKAIVRRRSNQVLDLGGGGPIHTISYVSDIHLEHQLPLAGKTDIEAQGMVSKYAKKLVHSAESYEREGLLLIAGDTADSPTCAGWFFSALKSRKDDSILTGTGNGNWQGKVVTVMGNHEIWNGDPRGKIPPQPLETILDSYRESIGDTRTAFSPVTLLHNELLIRFKGREWKRISAEEINQAGDKHLRALLLSSDLTILGGTGFAGLNSIFNAEEKKIYRNKVTRSKEIAESACFRALHDRLLSVANDLGVIILTHNPPPDWTDGSLGHNWVYIHGHSHRNGAQHLDTGTCIFHDAQIGYVPKRNPFVRSFSFPGLYTDPLEKKTEGIHSIQRTEYLDFCRRRGIDITSFQSEGSLYLVKRSNYYMFFLKNDKSQIYLLEGGKKRVAYHELYYYYRNLYRYVANVIMLFSSYIEALRRISAEVKAIGGDGTIHGSIVDIDLFNHIYLDAMTGKMKFYYAYDTTESIQFGSMRELLANSEWNEPLLESLEHEERTGKVHLISMRADSNQTVDIIPSFVKTEKIMYARSRTMRSIQYLFDTHVVRYWNEDILALERTIKLGLPSPTMQLPDGDRSE